MEHLWEFLSLQTSFSFLNQACRSRGKVVFSSGRNQATFPLFVNTNSFWKNWVTTSKEALQ